MSARALMLVLTLCAAAAAQKPDTGESAEKGFPWIAHSSMDGFYLTSPVEGGGTQPYQVSLYQGFTIQSLTFAWFHIGLRSRETMAPGFGSPYREPFNLKLAGNVEVLRDYLYLSLGGNIPILAGNVSIDDTLALYQSINGYNPMPFTDYLSPRAVQVGAYGHYRFTNWSLLGGADFVRPALFDLIPDKSFFPAPYFDLMGRAIYQTSGALHRFDARATFYSTEDNDLKIPAHGEGDLYQARYGYLKSFKHVGWQFGFGGALKLPDQNRHLKIASDLEPPGRDDNLQRVYGEAAMAWSPQPAILWRLSLLPKAYFNWSGNETGEEVEMGLSCGLKIWEYHRIRVGGQFLYGDVLDKKYVGIGVHGDFSFRHLGFQDIDDAPESGIE